MELEIVRTGNIRTVKKRDLLPTGPSLWGDHRALNATINIQDILLGDHEYEVTEEEFALVARCYPKKELRVVASMKMNMDTNEVVDAPNIKTLKTEATHANLLSSWERGELRELKLFLEEKL